MKTIHYPKIESIKPVKDKSSKSTARVEDEGKRNLHRERRAFDRVPTFAEARFLCGNRYYAGRITDISESGMFVSTDIRLPQNSPLEIIMLIDKKIEIIPVKVKRSVKASYRSDNFSYGGMGVELVRTPTAYLSYIHNLKTAV